MKAQTTAVHGTLALAGLVAAYMTWQRPPETAKAGTVVVAEISKQSLERIRYEDGTRFTELGRKTEGESRLLVTMGYLPGKAPLADAGVAAVDGGVIATSPPAALPPPTRELFASERAEGTYSKFTPLEATRALGVLKPEKLDELGLVDSPRRLDLKVAGVSRTFVVGKVIAGIIGTYIQDTQSNEVFLLPGTTIGDLDPSSQALVDRRPHAFRASEFDRLKVTFENQSTEFVQLKDGPAGPAGAKLARAETPDKADEMAKNWHDKIFSRLVIVDLLGKGETPKAGEPRVRLRIDYTHNSAPKGWIELASTPDKAVWARSENTAGWVAVHQGAEEWVIEATKLFDKASR